MHLIVLMNQTRMLLMIKNDVYRRVVRNCMWINSSPWYGKKTT